jgi:hypothetical protein
VTRAAIKPSSLSQHPRHPGRSQNHHPQAPDLRVTQAVGPRTILFETFADIHLTGRAGTVVVDFARRPRSSTLSGRPWRRARPTSSPISRVVLDDLADRQD